MWHIPQSLGGTLAKGSPVGVEKAGRSLFPRSCAISRSSPRYHGKWNGCPVWLAYIWPDKRPPRTRIVVSNTWGFVLTSNDTHLITFFTALSNPCRSSSTTSVSRTSMSVREKFPATSLAAMFLLYVYEQRRIDLRPYNSLTGLPSLVLAQNMKVGLTGCWIINIFRRYYKQENDLI